MRQTKHRLNTRKMTKIRTATVNVKRHIMSQSPGFICDSAALYFINWHRVILANVSFNLNMFCTVLTKHYALFITLCLCLEWLKGKPHDLKSEPLTIRLLVLHFIFVLILISYFSTYRFLRTNSLLCRHHQTW